MNIENEMELYLIEAKKQEFAWTTFNLYKANIKAFLKHFQHKENPSEITLLEFETYLAGWEKNQYKVCKG